VRSAPARFALLVAAATLASGCAVFGGGAGDEPRDGSPAERQAPPPEPVAAEADPAPSEIEARLRAGDYDGVLAAYAADSTLHTDEDATYAAGIAAAMSGHDGYDPRRAAELFQRLLVEHPDTPRRSEVELYLDMLGRERDLRSLVGRLDRELKQLKAIDLGQAPGEGEAKP
jgi:hypothetical protein